MDLKDLLELDEDDEDEDEEDELLELKHSICRALNIFVSDRGSRNANVRLSVCPS